MSYYIAVTEDAGTRGQQDPVILTLMVDRHLAPPHSVCPLLSLCLSFPLLFFLSRITLFQLWPVLAPFQMTTRVVFISVCLTAGIIMWHHYTCAGNSSRADFFMLRKLKARTSVVTPPPTIPSPALLFLPNTHTHTVAIVANALCNNIMPPTFSSEYRVPAVASPRASSSVVAVHVLYCRRR